MVRCSGEARASNHALTVPRTPWEFALRLVRGSRLAVATVREFTWTAVRGERLTMRAEEFAMRDGRSRYATAVSGLVCDRPYAGTASGNGTSPPAIRPSLAWSSSEVFPASACSETPSRLTQRPPT